MKRRRILTEVVCGTLIAAVNSSLLTLNLVGSASVASVAMAWMAAAMVVLGLMMSVRAALKAFEGHAIGS